MIRSQTVALPIFVDAARRRTFGTNWSRAGRAITVPTVVVAVVFVYTGVLAAALGRAANFRADRSERESLASLLLTSHFPDYPPAAARPILSNYSREWPRA